MPAARLVAGVAVAGAAATLYLLYRRRRAAAAAAKSLQTGDPNETVKPLLLTEATAHRQGFQPPNTTVTFFKGKAPVDYLRQRVGEMVRRNPWLGGRVLQRGGKLCIVYSKGSTFPPESFFTALPLHEVPLHSELSLLEVGRLAKPLEPPRGTNVTDTPLFRVTVVPDDRAPDEGFALLVSLSHSLGDGTTYYALLHMLDPIASVWPLSSCRHPETPAEQEAMVGQAEHAWAQSPLMPLGALVRGQFVKKMEPKAWLVEPDWVASQKARWKYESDAGFISTNDALASWFFKRVNASVGMMAADMRGKPGSSAHEADAGNYSAMLLYLPADYQTPALIRQSVRQMRRASEPPTQLPGAIGTLRSHVALLTNWASFHNGLSLPGGCEELVHYPVFNSIPINADMSLGIIFRARKDKLAMFTYSPRIAAAEGPSGPIGKPVV